MTEPTSRAGFAPGRRLSRIQPLTGIDRRPRAPQRHGRAVRLCTACRYALVGTTSKKPWIEGLVKQLLESPGRELRAQAASELSKPPRTGAPFAEGPKSRLRGTLVKAVVEVLRGADRPLGPAAVHRAVEERLGEPVAYGAVKNCLWEGALSPTCRFVRVEPGRYRLAGDDRTKS